MPRLGVTMDGTQLDHAEMLAKIQQLQAQLEAERTAAAKRESDARERIANLWTGQQEIFYETFRRFEGAGLEFAFPTRVLHVDAQIARSALARSALRG